jgi:hypothetical protein
MSFGESYQTVLDKSNVENIIDITKQSVNQKLYKIDWLFLRI